MKNKPVTKNAAVLTGSEYTRLALSGGICTVLVRTALNPLELVKTKIQLKNDEELLQLVNKKSQIDQNDSENSQTENKSADSKSGGPLLLPSLTTDGVPFSDQPLFPLQLQVNIFNHPNHCVGQELMVFPMF